MRRVLLVLIFAAVMFSSVAAAQGRSKLTYVAGKGNGSVWLANSRGGHAQRLGPGSQPLISPNGAAVAASLFASKGAALAIYRPGSAPAGYFEISKATAVALAWSPDSRYLAVQLTGVGPTGKGSGLSVLDVKTGNVRKLVTGSVCGASFAPKTPDRLVYGRAPGSFSCFGGAANIFTIRPSGLGWRQLTHDGESGNPVWGKRGIAFDRATPRPKLAPIFQIWMMRSGGTHARQITHLVVPPLLEGLVPIGFSSNGKRLLADYQGEDTSQTWTIQFPSGHARQLTVKGRSVVPDAISRNGRSVLVGLSGFAAPASAGTVEVIPFRGGHATVLVKHGAQASWNR